MGRNAERIVEFTDQSIRGKLKAATGQPQGEWRVRGVEGLVLVTQPTGAGAFYVFYTNELGKKRKLRLGAYVPESEAKRHEDTKAEHRPLTLTEARKLAEQQRHAVEAGADPYADHKAEIKEAKEALTFRQLADRFLDESQTLSASTKKVYRYALAKDVYPMIGDLSADSVTQQHVLAICQKIEARRTKEQSGRGVQSERTKTTIGGAYTWAIGEGLAKSNPCKDIGRRSSKVARSRMPSDAELARLWEATTQPASKLSPSMRYIIQLGILCGQRRTEVAGVRVSELSLDTDNPVWVIPGDVNKRGKIIEGRTKNGREQHVQLSNQAADLFRKALKECANEEFVFPADMSKVKVGKEPATPHINGDSVTRAVARLREAAEVEDVSIHDMRRAVSNWLKNEGVSREVRDLILNHKDPSVTEEHYTQKARMERQVRAALQAWADHVWVITGQGASADNVVKLRA